MKKRDCSVLSGKKEGGEGSCYTERPRRGRKGVTKGGQGEETWQERGKD